MPLNADLHLRGRLELGPYGLVFRPAGRGMWELETHRRARRLVGREVEVIGQRAGFNGLLCHQVWSAEEPRPRTPRTNIEYLVAVALVGYSFIPFLAGLVGYFR